MANVYKLAPWIFKWEGGFVNDPDDLGGATNMGVTISTWKQVGYDKDGDGKVYIVGQGESVKYLDEQEYLEWKKQIFWMPEMKIESCELGEILK